LILRAVSRSAERTCQGPDIRCFRLDLLLGSPRFAGSPLRSGSRLNRTNRPGDAPGLQLVNTVRSTCGAILIVPLKTRRPADWPGMADQRVGPTRRKKDPRGLRPRRARTTGPERQPLLPFHQMHLFHQINLPEIRHFFSSRLGLGAQPLALETPRIARRTTLAWSFAPEHNCLKPAGWAATYRGRVATVSRPP
jgi:hypothetical protein